MAETWTTMQRDWMERDDETGWNDRRRDWIFWRRMRGDGTKNGNGTTRADKLMNTFYFSFCSMYFFL